MENIYLLGFMGAGKSTIGSILAKKMGHKFVDSDSLIEKEVQMSIPEIFEKFGEEHFRNLESKVIDRLSQNESLIVALGGGAPIRRENRLKIKDGISVYLKVSPEIILKRTYEDDRPLLAGLDDKKRLQKICKMLSTRSKYYNLADLTVLNGERQPEKVAEEIRKKVRVYEKN